MAANGRHDVDLLEFERLRCEIDSRTQLAFGLVTLNITAIGAGFSLLAAFPDVVFGLSIVSCILWMLYVDHSAQVQKIAAYIGLRLAPRLRATAQDVLGWETFLRDLDGTEDSARRALGLDKNQRIRVYRSPAIHRTMSVLFGGAAPLLVSLGVAKSAAAHDLNSLRMVAVVGSALVWLYAVRFYFLERRTWRTINAAFTLQAQRIAAGDGQDAGAPAAADQAS